MTDLADLIPAGAVRIRAEVADWRSAVVAAGALLEEAGVADSAYTDAMVASVEEHGPYIVIAPGFALPHARPSDSVTRTGMSVLRLAHPVEFGHESNDPVEMVVALAAADSDQHQQALAQLAGVLADAEQRRRLFAARSEQSVRRVLRTRDAGAAPAGPPPATDPPSRGDDEGPTGADRAAGTGTETHLALTVCGNGLGTSLFLKNTLEQVLEDWGWTRYVNAEATDTISAKGRAKEAAFILTSGEIAKTLGDVGVPMEVIGDFTSKQEIDQALRRIYDV
ncbi:PTS sugar transporter subunit IIA [Helcobacillus massiliensis]|uniref:Ascorbate-specific PTS system EIIA component n=1 Tax=Helcobacillus massiliensis TaxID=521392 RepID=A0A839QSE0_9MICO|nr:MULTISPECIES: PTS sugar transporter subunit IIA [Helcobacillus]MBB3023224.1 PTS system ascorbate-specific IIA component [Helcobacillus massiliensis]MCG7427707.1 PTS sugar transporter subunit IIA [Helcobacillus sp. ACRRO]MCT1556600.1 PTS sugar transporter subunit IIA [Helcobacillus massiliensis]MCT2331124.1 PTS sugar transporter subunit IIA [Helcobacillus massiliensis]MDK7741997.1 PTS sugar transporter subunit IIA [Helcobacillus massiliensis]